MPQAGLPATLPNPVVARLDESWESPRPRLLLVEEIVAPPRRTLPGAQRAFWLAAGLHETFEARFRIRRPDDTTGPELPFSVAVERTADVVTERGTDRTGFLKFALSTDTATMTGVLTFSRAPIVGADVIAALPSIEFLQDFREPNVLQVSWELGDFVDYREAPPSEAVFPESLMEYLRSLAILQASLDGPILIPDLTTVTARDAQAVKDAGRLVMGHAVDSEWDAFTWATGPAVSFPAGQLDDAEQGGMELAFNRYYELLIVEPLIVPVGEREYTIGAMHTHLLSVRFSVDDDEHLRVEPFLNDSMRRIFAPDDPIPDRSHRPVLGKPIGLIDNPNDTETTSDAGDPATESTRDHGALYEALRDRVLLDALSEPVPLRLVQWHVVDEAPFAAPAQVWGDTLATVRTLLADGLVNLTEHSSDGEHPITDPAAADAALNNVVAQAEHRNIRPTWETGPWLTLTQPGQQIALSLAAQSGRPAESPRRRRRLHAAAAGRSGHADSSQRVDEILATEVWQ
ncbi:hypothetical protein [Candidatus Mycobacterium methanotrophicum]|uniref:Uncharacterized protein n=1 Tax=Candidatus Mycobacterium methanotrophicum TaxID=2943498 RepID=A0ABY4QN62_9MYCO|nr:hypothetical protein [Candidatus Mycobacterium methanotrophicum]UQX11401.1 hypothetical protein M5I08_02440 [Candidatus Mycobacterium methanotrophicum]